MSAFSAIALDTLLEPGISNSAKQSVHGVKSSNSRPPNPKLERSKSAVESNVPRPQMSPALYATPKVTPLPDPPSSFAPSPYIVNHKRRGAALSKSLSEVDVSMGQKEVLDGKTNGKVENTGTDGANLKNFNPVTFSITEPTAQENAHMIHESPLTDGGYENYVSLGHVDGSINGKLVSDDADNGFVSENTSPTSLALKLNGDDDFDDFYDPRECMSVTSSMKLGSQMGEFYDAYEDLSDSGSQSSFRDFETEMGGIRLSLLIEIEKRRLAEEALNHMKCNWQKIRQQLAPFGVALSADPTAVLEGQQLEINVAEELHRQFRIVQIVSDTIGRSIVKAEVEMEMKAQIELKNFEIARLTDRVHYYKAVNHEMTQRNQEAIGMARLDRQARKRRQKWIWRSIGAAITLGSAALAWSYLPSGNRPSSTNDSEVHSDL